MMKGLLATTADWIVLIPLISGAVTSMGAVVVSIISAVRVKDVQKQVTTGNGKTIAEAVNETHQVVMSNGEGRQK